MTRAREADDWKERADAAMDRYACGGEEAAFGELYDLLAPRLTAFLVRRTRDPARTEELVQQTFMQMHSARRHFSRGAAVMPWAFAIARRLLIDGHRKSEREGRPDPDGEVALEAQVDAGDPIDALVAKRRLAARLHDELARLPEPHRIAFELVQLEGMSMAEAAEVLGTTVSAVKLRAFRTYEALREKLGDELREELSPG